MPERNEVVRDPRFWAALYSSCFGAVGEPPEPDAVASLLGVDEEEMGRWWTEFTGWYPGVFDDSDGCVDDPATVVVPLAGGVELQVELHPGDEFWFLGDAAGEGAMLANVGPHFALPGLRWREAEAMAAAAPGGGWVVMLLLLPVTWITAGDDADQARAAVRAAWMESGLVTASAAEALAELWAAGVDGRDYAWRTSDEGGWVCDAQWSPRAASQLPAERALLERLVVAAAGAV
jgi:hypothetical protein